MKVYIISYDLLDNSKNYTDFYTAIKDINFDTPFQHITENSWLVRTEMSAKEIFNKIFPHIGQQSRLFISEINAENKSGWLGLPIWDWLNKEGGNTEEQTTE